MKEIDLTPSLKRGTTPEWALELAQKVLALPKGRALEIDAEDIKEWPEVQFGEGEFNRQKFQIIIRNAAKTLGAWSPHAANGYAKSWICTRWDKYRRRLILWSNRKEGATK